jgi:dipeptidyl aminopeptidase/acylaminoacyl peptidase
MRSKNGRMHGESRRPARRPRILGLAMCAGLAALLAGLALAWVAGNGASGAETAPGVARPIGPGAYPPAATKATLPHGRAYAVIRQAGGYTLMASDAPGEAVLVAPLPNHFGSETTDAVAALVLSPDQRWLAIDGMADHGDFVWVVDTTTHALRMDPPDATGNFLHWLPDGEHFLFRPFLPLRAATTDWNPGLWIVDALSGTHVNLPLPGDLPATAISDAAPSPDGTRIILSVAPGLGLGSTVYLATPDGLSMQPLFHSSAVVGAFAWSPDGQHIAYETIADSTVPFRPAGLWVMDAAGNAQRQIALADGGHGFAPAWSPDGTRLAFVARLNPTDPQANAAAGALVSAVQVASLTSGSLITVAAPAQTGQPRNIDPIWQPDGTLTFTAMAASTGYGAALAPTALWRATPQGGALRLALVPSAFNLAASVTLVP